MFKTNEKKREKKLKPMISYLIRKNKLKFKRIKM